MGVIRWVSGDFLNISLSTTAFILSSNSLQLSTEDSLIRRSRSFVLVLPGLWFGRCEPPQILSIPRPLEVLTP
jgi:hypothetical protein